MQDSFFTLNIAKDEKISPAEYGYWSVRWAADTAKKYQESETSDYWQTFHMYLHLLSLFTASYWVYAIRVSNAPETIIEKLEVGFNDCLNELLEPDGSPLSEKNKKFLYAYYRRYFVTLSEELEEAENPSSTPFSDLSEKFIEFVDYYYFKEINMDIIEKTRLSHQAADMPLIIFNLLKEQQLEYHANKMDIQSMSFFGKVVNNEFIKNDDDWYLQVFVENDDDEIISYTYDWSVIVYEAAYSLMVNESDQKAIKTLKIKGIDECNIGKALEQSKELIADQAELFKKVIFHENQYAEELDQLQPNWRGLSFGSKIDLIHKHQEIQEKAQEQKESKSWWKCW